MSSYVLGQCEGSLGNYDCGDCVKSADSISAKIYLCSCFISYNFYPNGVHNTSSSSSGKSLPMCMFGLTELLSVFGFPVNLIELL